MYLTIDTGAKGAMVLYTPKECINIYRFADYDWPTLGRIIHSVAHDIDRVWLEHVGAALPNQSSKTTFIQGRNCGWVEGVLDALSIPYTRILAKDWQKGLRVPPKLSYVERKAFLTTRLRELYPHLPLSSDRAKVVDESDAVLMLHQWQGLLEWK